MGQGQVGIPLISATAILHRSVHMQDEFNHPANDSPRSGSSKQVAPMVGIVVVVCIVALAFWFGIKA